MDKTIEQVLGESYEAIRKHRGKTQQDIYAETGVHNANVSKIESGKANPELDTLVRMAKAIGAQIVFVPLPETNEKFTERSASADQAGCRGQDGMDNIPGTGEVRQDRVLSPSAG